MSLLPSDCNANSELCGKYGVSGYPTLKWFSKEDKAHPTAYSESRELASFVSFINQNSGTHRLVNGRLTAEIGRIAEIDEVVSGYDDAEDKSAIIAQVKKIAAGLTGDAAKYYHFFPFAMIHIAHTLWLHPYRSAKVYLRTLELLQKKPDYIQTETDRLNRMLDGTNLTPNKIDEFVVRLNILSAFD